jgi:hypothetical protein
MIFKVRFGDHFPSAGKDTYLSFCESKFQLTHKLFKLFLYRTLFQRKLIDERRYDMFSCEMPLTIMNGRLIECYLKTNAKNKLFCSLTELMPYQAPVSIGLFDQLDYSWRGVIADMSRRATEDMAREIDRQVMDQLDRDVQELNPIPNNGGIIRQRLDYQAIGRRTFFLDQLPDGALPVFDQDIDIAPNVPVNPVEPPLNGDIALVPATPGVPHGMLRFDAQANEWIDAFAGLNPEVNDE